MHVFDSLLKIHVFSSTNEQIRILSPKQNEQVAQILYVLLME